MAGPNGLADCTWDSASCAFFRFGTTKIPLTKFEPPKDDIKIERLARIGEMRASKRTPGRSEISTASVELLLSDYATFILPRLGTHGGTLIEFVVTATVTHPSVNGSYGLLCDNGRIIGSEGPGFDGTEKGLIKKLTIDFLDIWEKGEDGKWKTLSIKPLPSSQAAPLLQF